MGRIVFINTYWRVFRIIVWVLRFKINSFVKLKKIKKKSGLLYIEEFVEVK